MELKRYIRDIPDFPKPGIVFKDITPLLGEPRAFKEAVAQLERRLRPQRPDVVAGIEARGFIFAAPLALALGAAFVPVRKQGKLPAETLDHEYQLEYGSATVEVHRDAIAAGQRVVIADDLLATGGTMAAARALVEKLGGQVVGLAVLIELESLHGRDKLPGANLVSLIKYP